MSSVDDLAEINGMIVALPAAEQAEVLKLATVLREMTRSNAGCLAFALVGVELDLASQAWEEGAPK